MSRGCVAAKTVVDRGREWAAVLVRCNRYCAVLVQRPTLAHPRPERVATRLSSPALYFFEGPKYAEIGRKLNVRARTEVRPQMDRVQLAPGARGKALTAGSNLCKTHWRSLKINR